MNIYKICINIPIPTYEFNIDFKLFIYDSNGAQIMQIILYSDFSPSRNFREKTDEIPI